MTQAKFNANTTGVLTSEAKSKFMEHWSKMDIKEEEDNNRRKEILEAIEPKIGNEPSKPVIEMEEVKKIAGNIKLCWGCLSQICWNKQRMSLKIINKKLINRHCPMKKIMLGDPNLVKILKGKVGKNNFVSVGDEVGKSEGPGGFGKPFNRRNNPTMNNLTMSVVKSSDPKPKVDEKI